MRQMGLRECNKINKQTYKLLQKDQKSKCILWTKVFLPFSDLNNENFIHTLKVKNINFTHVAEKKTEFFNQINSGTDIFENLSKYVIPNELNGFAKKQENLHFFHLNIISLQYHFTEFYNFLLPLMSNWCNWNYWI